MYNITYLLIASRGNRTPGQTLEGFYFTTKLLTLIRFAGIEPATVRLL